MNEMEFAPLACRKRTEYRMVGNHIAVAKTIIAISNSFIHAINVFEYRSCELFNRRAARQNALWRFAAAWKQAEANNVKPLPALRCSVSAAASFPRCQAVFAIFNSPEISEIQMVQNFCRAPLPQGMTREIVVRHSVNRVCKYGSQFRKFRVHV